MNDPLNKNYDLWRIQRIDAISLVPPIVCCDSCEKRAIMRVHGQPRLSLLIAFPPDAVHEDHLSLIRHSQACRYAGHQYGAEKVVL